ncbi:DNA replication complex GINS protein Sld5 isoform X1 [Rhipicephalus microplus]|uniref:DNA replication complex GINS protein Sld5 isoform X1 n=1 Tax=Rhipicephalus microplus TaxID=6941 RepID=UPI003F6A9B6A
MDSEPDVVDIANKYGYGENLEEECTSAEQVVQKLEEAWMNETFAPELLPYQNDIVDCVLDQLKYMQENLQRIDNADFIATMHKLEIERIQYILTSYLRTRLTKIEKHGAYILRQLETVDSDELLSPYERKFARAYIASIEDYLRDVALVHMPFNQQDFNMASVDRGPDLDEFVFVKVKRQTMGVLVDEGTSQSRIMDHLPKENHDGMRSSSGAHVVDLAETGVDAGAGRTV